MSCSSRGVLHLSGGPVLMQRGQPGPDKRRVYNHKWGVLRTIFLPSLCVSPCPCRFPLGQGCRRGGQGAGMESRGRGEQLAGLRG